MKAIWQFLKTKVWPIVRDILITLLAGQEVTKHL